MNPNKNTIQKWVDEGRIFFGKDGNGAPQLKRYLNEVQQGRVPTTWWPFTEAGHNDAANKELKSLFKSSTANLYEGGFLRPNTLNNFLPQYLKVYL